MLEIKNHRNGQFLLDKDFQPIKQAVFQDQELIKVAFQLIGDAVIITDASGRVQFLNSMAEKLTGWREQEAQSLPCSKIFQLIDEITLMPLEFPSEQVLPETRIIKSVNPALLIGRNNISSIIEHSAANFYGSDNQIAGAVLVFREVGHSRSSIRDSSWQVHYDFLTGLIDRHSFEQYLEQEISSATKLDQQSILCQLDIDRFKIINETCGHAAGDEFLRQISLILQKRVRKTDILARLGGDEFGLLLYECNLEQALNVVQVLREAVQKFQFVWENQTFSSSLSIGLLVLNGENNNSSSILSAVNSACNTAKTKGRNRVYIYQSNTLEVATQRGEIQWIPRILKALAENQFILYSQPIISLVSRDGENPLVPKVSWEILLRLQDEEGQIVAAGEFIPAAEKYGLINLIDRWVIQTLFAYLRQKDGEAETPSQSHDDHFIYTINLSGATLNDDEFLDFIKEQFVLNSIRPQSICFEITETVAISNLNRVTHLIQELKSIGCCFALDDFGSGMSSFGYLKNLSVDYLKIDGMFIKDIIENQLACEIVEAINRVAHVMNIHTVAEYVENDEILLKLKTLGIDYAQGYGIGKPHPFMTS